MRFNKRKGLPQQDEHFCFCPLIRMERLTDLL
jgi:hypothetical protein